MKNKSEFRNKQDYPAGSNTGDFQLLKSLEFRQNLEPLQRIPEPIPIFGISFDTKGCHKHNFAYKMRKQDEAVKIDIYSQRTLIDETEYEHLYTLDMDEKYYFQILYSKEGRVIYSVSKIVNGELTLLSLRLYALSEQFRNCQCWEC